MEAGGPVRGEDGVVGVSAHPSGVTLNGVVVLPLSEQRVALKEVINNQ